MVAAASGVAGVTVANSTARDSWALLTSGGSSGFRERCADARALAEAAPREEVRAAAGSGVGGGEPEEPRGSGTLASSSLASPPRAHLGVANGLRDRPRIRLRVRLSDRVRVDVRVRFLG